MSHAAFLVLNVLKIITISERKHEADEKMKCDLFISTKNKHTLSHFFFFLLLLTQIIE